MPLRYTLSRTSYGRSILEGRPPCRPLTAANPSLFMPKFSANRPMRIRGWYKTEVLDEKLRGALLVRLAGFEPTTSASGGQRSVQLSYRRNRGRILEYGIIRKPILTRTDRHRSGNPALATASHHTGSDKLEGGAPRRRDIVWIMKGLWAASGLAELAPSKAQPSH